MGRLNKEIDFPYLFWYPNDRYPAYKNRTFRRMRFSFFICLNIPTRIPKRTKTYKNQSE
nr:MAG TPA: hypothetical protein [Caudoviricetes sp.]